MFDRKQPAVAFQRVRIRWRNGYRGWLWVNLTIVVVVWVFAITPASGQEIDYRLGAGDQLRITVFGQEELSGEFEVSGNGNISFPLIGKVVALDLTLSKLERAIVEKLKPDYLKNPRVSIEILNYRPFYILGEIKNPGSYPYVVGMRVVNAVAIAGGFTYRANQRKVLIIRANTPDGKPQPADPNTVVLPGDVIEILERFF